MSALAFAVVQEQGRGSEPEASCVARAERLDAALDEALAATEAEQAELLADVQRAREATGDLQAPCAARLAKVEMSALMLLYRDDEALAAATDLLDRYGDVAAPKTRSIVFQNRGFLLAQLGRMQASTLSYVGAAALADRLPTASAVQALLSAAITFQEVHDVPRAVGYLDAAERAAERDTTAEVRSLRGEVRLQRAILLESVADGDPDPAATRDAVGETAQDALALLSDDDAGRPMQAVALHVIARMHARAGRAEAARAALDRARPVVDETARLAPLLRVDREVTAGRLAEAEGETASARAAYERGIAVAREEELPEGVQQAQMALARLEEAAGDAERAEAIYRDAIALGETARLRLGLQDWSVAASEAVSEPYARLARLLARGGRVEEGLATLDASRARHLLDLRGAAERRTDLGTDAVLEAGALLDSLDGLRARRLDAAAGSPEQSRLDGAITRLQAELADATGVRPQAPQPLSLSAVRRALRSRRQALVSYALGDADGTAFVVTPDSVLAVDLPDAGRAELQRALAALGAMWAPASSAPLQDASGARDAAPVDPAFALDALEDLYARLVAPIDGHLPPGAGLVVVPDVAIAGLPFAMLVRPGGAPAGYADADVLVRHRAVSIELAAALVAEPDETPEGQTVDVVFGRSRFEAQDDLPHVVDEVERVALRLPMARVRLDRTATERAFRDALPGARVVHLASHAVADPAFPLYSRIELWPDRAEDGTLHLYELERDPLAAELVTLSGCETAQGAALRGEGTIGLQYAVRAAGARSAVATLWPVDDAATVEVMDAFYGHLADGVPKDRALQRAQLAYLDAHDGLDASPFFWAAAVLSGDPAPLTPVSASWSLGWWLAIVGVGASGLVAWRLLTSKTARGRPRPV